MFRLVRFPIAAGIDPLRELEERALQERRTETRRTNNEESRR